MGLCLPAIVYFHRDYTSMHVWIGIFSALALPTYFIIPEPIRWLVANNRWKDAEKILLVTIIMWHLWALLRAPLENEDQEQDSLANNGRGKGHFYFYLS